MPIKRLVHIDSSIVAHYQILNEIEKYRSHACFSVRFPSIIVVIRAIREKSFVAFFNSFHLFRIHRVSTHTLKHLYIDESKMNLFSSLCYISIQWLVCIYFLSVTLVTAYKDGHDNAEWFRNNIPQPLLSRPQWLKINFPASIRIESTEPNKNLNGNLYRDKSIITINMRKGEKESVEGKVKKNIDNNHSITVEHSIESK